MRFAWAANPHGTWAACPPRQARDGGECARTASRRELLLSAFWPLSARKYPRER
jgi:hypothetical protein